MRYRNDGDPAATLTSLTQTPDLPGQEAADPWQTSLRRLMIAGGDWQTWIAKMPAGDTKTWGAKALTEESRLLESLRALTP